MSNTLPCAGTKLIRQDLGWLRPAEDPARDNACYVGKRMTSITLLTHDVTINSRAVTEKAIKEAKSVEHRHYLLSASC